MSERILRVDADGLHEPGSTPSALMALPLVVRGGDGPELERVAEAFLERFDALLAEFPQIVHPRANDPLAYAACWLQAQALDAVQTMLGVDTAAIRRMVSGMMDGPPPRPVKGHGG